MARADCRNLVSEHLLDFRATGRRNIAAYPALLNGTCTTPGMIKLWLVLAICGGVAAEVMCWGGFIPSLESVGKITQSYRCNIRGGEVDKIIFFPSDHLPPARRLQLTICPTLGVSLIELREITKRWTSCGPAAATVSDAVRWIRVRRRRERNRATPRDGHERPRPRSLHSSNGQMPAGLRIVSGRLRAEPFF